MTGLEKTTRINYLFDFYQALLTPKQRNYMSLYYLDDFSLGEIAEEFQVSRQAVYDNIKRTEVMLEDYEEKLKLFHKYQKRKKVTKQMKLCLDEGKLDKVMLEHYLGLLDELD
ncbi:putative DNA-binding protein [Lederbergia ruris]|uniref:UPF0122 protein J8TS2_18600 n=1 Tax=Lederbergia ruris TaxID=217495 RepID=A0ABQ4KJ98_9BACI|nr:putative DNA-binding protein [Lederbergia ruris]GIN57541.1 UPF0122 protein [Lederbergia ruris]